MSRRLLITESQLEYIINNIGRLDEQVTKKDLDFSETFASGKHKINDIDQSQIDSIINDVLSFINDHPNKKYVINIEGSESKVPNPAGFETAGSLAKERVKNIINYIKNRLGEYKDLVEFKTNILVGGPEWDDKKGKDHKDYTAHQYIKGNISLKAEDDDSSTIPKLPVFWGNYKMFKSAQFTNLWYKEPSEKRFTQTSLQDKCQLSNESIRKNKGGGKLTKEVLSKSTGSCSGNNILTQLKNDFLIDPSVTQKEFMGVIGLGLYQGENDTFKVNELVGDDFFNALKKSSIGDKVYYQPKNNK
jgi:hypothetical protein